MADSICNVLGQKEDIWYAKTIELAHYINAIKALEYKDNTVYNPSETVSVWLKTSENKVVELLPKSRRDTKFTSTFLSVNTIDSLYPKSSVDIKYHGDWTKVNYQQRLAIFKKAPLQFGDVVFLGNSITEQGGDWSYRTGHPNVRNRGIAGDVTDGVLARIKELTYFKPKSVFVLIGINDLFNYHFQKEIPSIEYVANNIIKITEQLHARSPDTKIFLQTILPTSQPYMTAYINKVNTLIKNYEKEHHYKVIDLFKVFAEDNQLIKPDLTLDGTHLNEKGYRLWVNIIKSELNH